MWMIIIWASVFLLAIVLFALMYFKRLTKKDWERWQKPKIHDEEQTAFEDEKAELNKRQ